jgi:hypothetical protein
MRHWIRRPRIEAQSHRHGAGGWFVGFVLPLIHQATHELAQRVAVVSRWEGHGPTQSLCRLAQPAHHEPVGQSLPKRAPNLAAALVPVN